ncbi:MAG TPA: beta-ketoacyl-ACP synthase I, partial [Methylophaga sp.]|nr:beta-ketoacyl-ACP synthase I [Methylophaga sp.]
VVVTGMGITSCLGVDLATVTESLRAGRSGIRFKQQYADMGFRS